MADSFADAGFAVVAIDLPLHGVTNTKDPLYASAANPLYAGLGLPASQMSIERTFDLELTTPGTIDSSGSHFINLTSPLTSRDNLREGETDLITFERSVAGATVANAGGITLFASGKTHYLGHSLGAIVGGVFLAVVPTTEVSTGDARQPRRRLAQLLIDSPTFAPQINAGLERAGPHPRHDAVRAIHPRHPDVVDSGDPVNFIALATAQHPIHLLQVVGSTPAPASCNPSAPANGCPDQVVPNSATQALITASAYGPGGAADTLTRIPAPGGARTAAEPERLPGLRELPGRRPWLDHRRCRARGDRGDAGRGDQLRRFQRAGDSHQRPERDSAVTAHGGDSSSTRRAGPVGRPASCPLQCRAMFRRAPDNAKATADERPGFLRRAACAPQPRQLLAHLRSGRPASGAPDRCRDPRGARDAPHQRRRRRRGERAHSRGAAGARGSPRAQRRRGADRSASPQHRRDPRSLRAAARHRTRPPAVRDPGGRRQRLGQDDHDRQARAALRDAGPHACCWPPGTPFAPPRSSSCRCGPSAPGRSSPRNCRAPIPERWSSMPWPRRARAAATWCSPIPPAGCTASRT